jgi:hypothetical protein
MLHAVAIRAALTEHLKIASLFTKKRFRILQEFVVLRLRYIQPSVQDSQAIEAICRNVIRSTTKIAKIWLKRPSWSMLIKTNARIT